MWKKEEGKKRHGKVKEVREVIESWVVGKDGEEDEKTVLIKEKDDTGSDAIRKRRTEQKIEI